jgi:hypothetical protein
MTSTYRETEKLAEGITKSASLADSFRNLVSGALRTGKKTGKYFGGHLFTNNKDGIPVNAMRDFIQSTAGGLGRNLADNLNMKYWSPKPPFGETASKVLQTAGVGMGIGGGIVGIAALIEKYNLHRKQMASPMFFQEMLLKNNDVNDYYLSGEEGKTRVEDLYRLLEHFAPKIAENALATGTFIRQYMKYGELGANMDIIAALSKINKDSQDSKPGLPGLATGKLFEQSVSTGFKFDPTYG